MRGKGGEWDAAGDAGVGCTGGGGGELFEFWEWEVLLTMRRCCLLPAALRSRLVLVEFKLKLK